MHNLYLTAKDAKREFDKLPYLVAKRVFDDNHELIAMPRADREKTYHVSLFNPKWQYKGIKPTLNWVYKDMTSNIPQLYQYQNQRVYLLLYREF